MTEDILRKALGPTDGCPTIEDLEAVASKDAVAAGRWLGHVQACGYCQTELHLLERFRAEKREASQDANHAVELLEKKKKEIFKQAFPLQKNAPWWKAAFTMPRLAQASFAMAAILLLVGAVLLFRSTGPRPQLEARNDNPRDVLRSGSFAVLNPAGDVQERPSEIRWEQVPAAAIYQVTIREVDRRQVWEAKTSNTRIELPESIRARIVPAKTLFAEVTAFDSSGNQIAATELVRFRFVPHRK